MFDAVTEFDSLSDLATKMVPVSHTLQIAACSMLAAWLACAPLARAAGVCRLRIQPLTHLHHPPPRPQGYRKRHMNVLGPAVGPTTANGVVAAFLLGHAK